MSSARHRRSLQSYRHIALETQALSASPTQLITLLMDGALVAMRKAKRFMQAGDVRGRGASISKAIDIVESGLKASVKRDEGKAGSSLADNLIATYDIVVHHLLQANLHARVENLDVAEQMLSNVREAWQKAVGVADSVS